MTDAEKALRLVGRYARLQHRMHQCKQATGRLFDACENPLYEGDNQIGSGCINALSEAKRAGRLAYGPDGESNWFRVLDEIECCRACRLGLKVSRHRKRALTARRTSVLGAMKRLGSKQRKE